MAQSNPRNLDCWPQPGDCQQPVEQRRSGPTAGRPRAFILILGDPARDRVCWRPAVPPHASSSWADSGEPTLGGDRVRCPLRRTCDRPSRAGRSRGRPGGARDFGRRAPTRRGPMAAARPCRAATARLGRGAVVAQALRLQRAGPGTIKGGCASGGVERSEAYAAALAELPRRCQATPRRRTPRGCVAPSRACVVPIRGARGSQESRPRGAASRPRRGYRHGPARSVACS